MSATKRKANKYLSILLLKYNSRSQDLGAASPRGKERRIHENQNRVTAVVPGICLANGTAVRQNYANVSTVLGTSTFALHGYGTFQCLRGNGLHGCDNSMLAW